MPETVPINKDELPVESVVVRERNLTPCNAEKLSVMKDSLHLLDNQDINSMFVTIMSALAERGFKLKGDPYDLLNAIDRKHLRG